MEHNLLTILQGEINEGMKLDQLKKRSIIPALDCSLEKAVEIVINTHTDVQAYKIGFQLALIRGLPEVVHKLRNACQEEICLIYDHQKGGTDIPETGEAFMEICKLSGIDAVILFPLTGPTTQNKWITSARDYEMDLIIGGEMTHPNFLNTVGEDGYISANAPKWIYENALAMGIKHFVVPGNKPERVEYYRSILGNDVTFYSPGLVTQGGSIEASGKVAGEKWHCIVGRALTKSDDIRKTIKELTSNL
jgi:orotidine-5'-phosphate decarboxylase